MKSQNKILFFLIIAFVLVAMLPGHSLAQTKRGRSAVTESIPREIRSYQIRDYFIPSKDKEVGYIDSSVGSAIVTRKSKEAYFADRGDRLYVSDTIYTLRNSKCRIKTIGDETVSIAPDSRLSINAYSFGTKTPKKAVFGMTTGKGLYNVKKMSKGEEVRVETPTAVCAVRGTEFAVDVSDQSTTLHCFEGTVLMISSVDGSQANVPSGQSNTSTTSGLGTPLPTPVGVEEKYKAETSADQAKEDSSRKTVPVTLNNAQPPSTPSSTPVTGGGTVFNSSFYMTGGDPWLTGPAKTGSSIPYSPSSGPTPPSSPVLRFDDLPTPPSSFPANLDPSGAGSYLYNGFTFQGNWQYISDNYYKSNNNNSFGFPSSPYALHADTRLGTEHFITSGAPFNFLGAYFGTWTTYDNKDGGTLELQIIGYRNGVQVASTVLSLNALTQMSGGSAIISLEAGPLLYYPLNFMNIDTLQFIELGKLGDGGWIMDELYFSQVPLPCSLLLMISGLAFISLIRRQVRR